MLWAPFAAQNTGSANANSIRLFIFFNINLQFLLIYSTEPTFDPSIANCDFESGFCLYTQQQGTGSPWRRVSVKPNIIRNGDHTTGAGEEKTSPHWK